MFYCEACAKKSKWPYEFWMGQSHGPCEICGKTSVCVDVPSSALPVPKRDKNNPADH